jgi:Uma2 family endonuclease
MAKTSSAVPTDPRLSREAYRHWAQAQPGGRFERIDGCVVAMAPERLGHADCPA